MWGVALCGTEIGTMLHVERSFVWCWNWDSARRGEGSASHPGRSLPPGKSQYPLYWKLDGSQGRYGQVRKISTPPGIDPRNVQPVASRYTDYATGPPGYRYGANNQTYRVLTLVFSVFPLRSVVTSKTGLPVFTKSLWIINRPLKLSILYPPFLSFLRSLRTEQHLR